MSIELLKANHEADRLKYGTATKNKAARRLLR